MADSTPRKSAANLENGVGDLRLKSEEQSTQDLVAGTTIKRESSFDGISGRNTPSVSNAKKSSRSPVKMESATASPGVKTETELVGGDVTIKQEPGKPPKLARTSTQKVERRPPTLFLDWEDKTAEATSTFEVLGDCTYANKQLGITDPALECDCQEEWDSNTHTNDACGDGSDCINRATKMECSQDCGCGNHCQNQRFTRKLYADVTVIKTEKKGYGLRANKDLSADDFIFEYIGEVIGENAFRKRMQLYDQEGIKHFYFMSLEKGIFVDATRRGNLGRFCNHSCNPNCYVDKWVVGDKLRMGIFAERAIKAGEELVFNYNVDRYGADPQPCYCGEPNCTGYIGGKTQTERSTKLSKATIEALGIDDVDSWDIATAKKPRKKKGVDEDEEYVNNLQPKELEHDGVRSVMAQLPQCKEKWIVVKLLNRIQRAEDSMVLNQVVRMHGYRHLKTALGNFSDDVNICLQILDILNKLPRITRNKIQDSRIEDAVQQLVANEDERVATQSKDLLETWSKLEIAYRIPRMKRDPNAAPLIKHERVDRRDSERRRSRSRSKSPEKIHAPSGPRNTAPRPRPPPRYRPPPSGPLPSGWFEAAAGNGSTYYYHQNGATTWTRPTAPSGPLPPPPPPKAVSDQQRLTELISNIVANTKEPVKAVSATATPAEPTAEEKREAKWRSYPEEKQKKLYEGLMQPHVMHVVNKFKHKIEKEELKRLAKDVSKKIVNSDFKHDNVKSLSKLDDKHARKIKKHVHETFVKYMRKKAEHDKKKQAHSKDNAAAVSITNGDVKLEDEPALSDDEDGANDALATPSTKRPRDDLESEEAALKRSRLESDMVPPPPPPPPAESEIGSPMELDSPSEHVAGAPLQADEPMQTATPPTTGSPGLHESTKAEH